jgi:DNA-binding MarR family transcriptional regulator
MTDLLSDLGALALASRLKRMGDTIINGGIQIYRHYGYDFEPKWFPIYYFLSVNTEVGIMEIAENLKISHPAVIQLAKELEKSGLIVSKKSKLDARKRLLKLSKKGLAILPELQKIWSEIKQVNTGIIEAQENNLLNALSELERNWSLEYFMAEFKKLQIREPLYGLNNLK